MRSFSCVSYDQEKLSETCFVEINQLLTSVTQGTGLNWIRVVLGLAFVQFLPEKAVAFYSTGVLKKIDEFECGQQVNVSAK